MNVGGISCPVCSGEKCLVLRPYQGRHAIFAGLHLARCGDCGMVFADPMPSQDAWDAYNRDFFAASESDPSDNPQALLFSQGIALLRLAHIADELEGALPEPGLGIIPDPSSTLIISTLDEGLCCSSL